jgi:hypothetical protein
MWVVIFLYFVWAQSCRKLPHFPAATDGCTSDVEPDTRQLVRCQNKKKKKSGGFQSMGEDRRSSPDVQVMLLSSC